MSARPVVETKTIKPSWTSTVSEPFGVFVKADLTEYMMLR